MPRDCRCFWLWGELQSLWWEVPCLFFSILKKGGGTFNLSPWYLMDRGEIFNILKISSFSKRRSLSIRVRFQLNWLGINLREIQKRKRSNHLSFALHCSGKAMEISCGSNGHRVNESEFSCCFPYFRGLSEKNSKVKNCNVYFQRKQCSEACKR